MHLPPIAASPAAVPHTPDAREIAARRSDAAARKAAQDFEAAFLAEMLKTAGVNELRTGFGGGAGEEAFASLLTDEYARKMTAAGGIGLAERVYQILKSR